MYFKNLDNITIGGKDADKYSLPEIAEFEEKRHYLLLKKLEEKFKAGSLIKRLKIFRT